ncbi:MAG: site-specific integrase [Lachnospiraceae bacterium]|nr:site-specific integrase [Lachnospiraceae bacterium]
MKKARTDSKGNILYVGEYERKDGRYVFQYMDLCGETKWIYATRLFELRHEEAKIKYVQSVKLLKNMREITLNDQFEIWFAGKMNLRENTKQNYKFAYDAYLRNNLGKMPIDEITTFDIKCRYERMIGCERKAVITAAHVQNILFQVMQSAVESGIIMTNPANNALKSFKRKHSKHTSTRRGLFSEEINLFNKYLKNSSEFKRWYPLIFVMNQTGMRLGEITGLEWENVHFEEKRIVINQTLNYIVHGENGAKYVIANPKTPSSVRTIPMTAKVIEALLMEKEYQKKNRITCKSMVDGHNNFVFLNRFGMVYNQASVNRALKRIQWSFNEAGIKNKDGKDVILPSFTSHDLRHTFANVLCEKHVNVKVVQALMGQSDIETTMNIYTKVEEHFLREEYFKKMEEE